MILVPCPWRQIKRHMDSVGKLFDRGLEVGEERREKIRMETKFASDFGLEYLYKKVEFEM